ncbi:RDD family protein [Maribacter sp. 2-571]|uniref:RDD family protein n=1 Tax=Maribacter sp. 2-571 TaxID=3417569 RepID=UPI003D347780
MTREAQLRFCKVCTNGKKDFNRGIVCGLTDRLADFENTCDTFQEDEELQQKVALQHSYTNAILAASANKRLANYLIDQVFLVGCGMLIGVMLGLVLVYFYPEHLYLLDEENRLVEYVLGVIIAMLYYSFFEGFTGRSLGKFFTKTKVVTEDGDRPDFKTVFIRSLCRHIPFNAFSFLGGEGIGWHDKFSGTRVVEIE